VGNDPNLRSPEDERQVPPARMAIRMKLSTGKFSQKML
jgi:hypothetical protein